MSMIHFLKHKIKFFNFRLFFIKYINIFFGYLNNIWIKFNKKFFFKSQKSGADLSNVIDIVNINFFDWNGQELYRGGAERYVFDLACLIKGMGYIPRIIQNANFPFEKQYCGIPVIGIPAKSEWNFRKFFWYYLNYFDGSSHVICSPLDIACFPTTKKILGINHGIHWDGISNRVFLRHNHKILFRSLSNIKSGICVDTNFINWVRTFDRVLADKLEYIPNYFDQKQFVYKEKDFSSDKIVVTYPRRIYPQRGSRLVFNVLDSILTRHKNVIFHFVGQANGEDERILKKYLKKYPKKIKWSILDMDQMGSVYEESQIILIPTVASEGTSLSCIEAMATNNAVIATDIGGLPNLIINRFNGFLIKPDLDALKFALDELILNKQKRIFLARNAYQTARVFEKQNWEESWKRILHDFLSD